MAIGLDVIGRTGAERHEGSFAERFLDSVDDIFELLGAICLRHVVSWWPLSLRTSTRPALELNR